MTDLSCSPYSSLAIKVKLKILLQWATNLAVQNLFAHTLLVGKKKLYCWALKY